MVGAKINASNTSQINYKIHNFPVPALVIDEIKEDGKIELKNIKIKFSLWSVLSFNHKISDVEIDQVIIHLSNDDVNYIGHDEFITELINKKALNVSAKIGKLIFVESDKDVPFTIENFIFFGNEKTTKFNGELSSVGKLKGEFIRNLDQINFNLDLDNPGYHVALKEIYEKSMLKSGKIEIITSVLARELVSLLPDFVNLSDELVSDEEVKISLDIVPLNNWINFKNIVIQSKSIQGSGEIALSKNNQDISDVKINFSKIDLDSWGEKKDVDDDNENNIPYSSDIINKLAFNQNTRVTISAKEIILSPDNIVTDASLKFLNQDNQVKIEDFFGAFDKSGGFRVNGIVSENSFRSLFKGRIAINHKDLNDLAEFIGGSKVRTENKIPYSLVSDIKFSSVDVSMQDLLIKTDSSEITGSFSTKFIGNSPRTNANLQINKVDLDKKDLPLLNYLYNYALGLTENSKKEDYLNKFIPLREIDSINDYDISFDQLTLNDNLYKNVKFNLSLIPGQIKLENLSLSDGKNYADMTIELIASAIKPSFDVRIHGGVLEVDFLSPRSISELRKQILEKVALDKVDLNVNFNLDKVYQGDFVLGRVILKAKNNKTLFEISKFDADMLGGRMYSTGSVLLDPYTINFVYALNSAIIPEIAKLMPSGFLETGGVISTSGMWSTNGDSLEEQLYNLYTKSNIITKDITVSNFSIDNIVKAAAAPDYNIKAFKDDMKKALLTGKTEISELKADIELTKGLFDFQNMTFKTKYTAGAAAARFNLYNLNIDLSSVFSFYLSKPTYGRSYKDYATATLTVKATGNLLTPKKEADTKEFEDLLNAIMTVKKK
ncbi:MAG: AsmA-like C-terminal region-containing protein [Rickettsiaceae bacterium]